MREQDILYRQTARRSDDQTTDKGYRISSTGLLPIELKKICVLVYAKCELPNKH